MLPHTRRPLARQPIGALIHWVAAMPAYPAPVYLVGLGGEVKALPEVGIDDGLAVGLFPAALFPAVYPFLDAFLHILAVGIKHHRAGAGEAF